MIEIGGYYSFDDPFLGDISLKLVDVTSNIAANETNYTWMEDRTNTLYLDRGGNAICTTEMIQLRELDIKRLNKILDENT